MGVDLKLPYAAAAAYQTGAAWNALLGEFSIKLPDRISHSVVLRFRPFISPKQNASVVS
jgi:hypothetical protein